VGALTFQHLPARHQTQPERAVSGIARGGGEAAAFVGATLEFVMAPGADGSESDRNFCLLDGRMVDGGVQHAGSPCNENDDEVFCLTSVFCLTLSTTMDG
jgi:hypothetical protein